MKKYLVTLNRVRPWVQNEFIRITVSYHIDSTTVDRSEQLEDARSEFIRLVDSFSEIDPMNRYRIGDFDQFKIEIFGPVNTGKPVFSFTTSIIKL